MLFRFRTMSTKHIRNGFNIRECILYISKHIPRVLSRTLYVGGKECKNMAILRGSFYALLLLSQGQSDVIEEILKH